MRVLKAILVAFLFSLLSLEGIAGVSGPSPFSPLSTAPAVPSPNRQVLSCISQIPLWQPADSFTSQRPPSSWPARFSAPTPLIRYEGLPDPSFTLHRKGEMFITAKQKYDEMPDSVKQVIPMLDDLGIAIMSTAPFRQLASGTKTAATAGITAIAGLNAVAETLSETMDYGVLSGVATLAAQTGLTLYLPIKHLPALSHEIAARSGALRPLLEHPAGEVTFIAVPVIYLLGKAARGAQEDAAALSMALNRQRGNQNWFINNLATWNAIPVEATARARGLVPNNPFAQGPATQFSGPNKPVSRLQLLYSYLENPSAPASLAPPPGLQLSPEEYFELKRLTPMRLNQEFANDFTSSDLAVISARIHKVTELYEIQHRLI